MRTPRMTTVIILLGILATFVHAAPGGNKKNHVLEQELQFVKENLTDVWEVLSQLRSQIERLESEERIHHHHHHYHHYYHDNFTEEVNQTEYEDHDRNFEHRLYQHKIEGSNNPHHNSNKSTHRHHHHHVHHYHSKLEPNPGEHKPNSTSENHDEILAKATCYVRPNRALPQNERQNIRGTVDFKQKGNILEIDVNIRGFVTPLQIPSYDIEHSRVHALHVHEFGDLSNGCESAGELFNPLNGVVNGDADSPKRHIGDLGTVECDAEGNVQKRFPNNLASLNGTYSIIGKTLVISENNGDISNGNSGRRLACCIIVKEELKNNNNHH